MRYFMVELLTALLFLIIFLRYCTLDGNWSWVVLSGWVFVSLLLIATFTDLDHWIIPDQVSIGGTVAGIVAAAIWPLGLAPHNPVGQPIKYLAVPEIVLPLIQSVAGAVMGFSLLWSIGMIGTVIFRKEAMGRGDMKLFAMFGAFLGPINCLYVFMAACLFGSIFGIGGIVLGWLDRGRPVDPAVAQAPLTPTSFTDLANHYELSPREMIVLGRVVGEASEGSPPRHHLPFGPSLALAAAIVFLTWEPIQGWVISQLMLPAY
jgi:prepilin signal peptidase PulO-like enzyme (type II secretory pathway)